MAQAAASPDPIVRCEHVTKRWPRARNAAVADISLEIAQGACCVFVGATGSGKSALLRLIAGLTAPDGGILTVNGVSVAQNHPAIQTFASYMAPENDVPEGVGVADLLSLTGMLRGMSAKEARSACHDLLDRAGLDAVVRRPLRALPPAQQQLARFCATLMGYPHLLVLDDPARDLDPTQHTWFWGLLRQLHEETGMTIILATSDLSAVERLATQVVFLREGQVMAAGTPQALERQFGIGPRMDMRLKPGSQLTDEMRRQLRTLGELVELERYTLALYPKPDVIGSLAQQVSAPAQPRSRARTNAGKVSNTPSTPVDMRADSWLLDRSGLPGTLGRTVDEIFAILGAFQIAEFWFSPPTLLDVYQRIEGDKA
ncbi:MAG TPA: ABC transporter ATP-binding protein [Ktedonobacterales bacterium]|nr:ABC transporter ATP-binding protein [Ktedonobacterales bacterium]